MIYTTEHLTSILVREFDRCTSIISDKPNQLRSAFDIEQDAIACTAYRDIRKQVWDYQMQHQISGLVWCEYDYAGHAIAFPKPHDQLIAIENDIEALKAAKRDVVQWWLKVVEGKTIWRDYDADHRLISNREEVVSIARRADWAIPVIDHGLTPRVILTLEWGVPEDAVRGDRPSSGRINFSGCS